MGKISVALACLTLVAALVVGIVIARRTGGDAGVMAGIAHALIIAKVGFGLGALSGIVGLLQRSSRAAAIVGLACNLAGEIAVHVLM